MSVNRELFRAEERIQELRAELAVRTVLIVTPDWEKATTADKRAGRRSAYSSGYERGWRGLALKELYSQDWMKVSYERGWTAGREDSQAAISMLLDRAKR